MEKIEWPQVSPGREAMREQIQAAVQRTTLRDSAIRDYEMLGDVRVSFAKDLYATLGVDVPIDGDMLAIGRFYA